MADFTVWLRRLRRHPSEADADRTVTTRARPDPVDWVLLESVGSAPLGGMYADLLRQAAIPVRMLQWDPGSGALGGQPIGLRLLVPSDMLSAAREVLAMDEVGKGDSHEG